MFKNLWALIRPYCTVTRVTVVVSGALTPPLALLAGKLAVVLASWGIALDQTKTTAVFIAGAAAVVAAVVPIVRKFIDSRTQFETALINQGQAFMIGGKSLSAQLSEDPPVSPDWKTESVPEYGGNALVVSGLPGEPVPEPDADYRASQAHGEFADPTDLGPADVANTDPSRLPDEDV